jgi:SAM-dependent methyltransferase
VLTEIMMHEPPPDRFRPDFLQRQHILGDRRPWDRVLAHYLLERKLSERLRYAPRESRALVYTEVYRELFALLPDHPQRCLNSDHLERVDVQLRQITRYLRQESIFLEIGCGDAALVFAAAGRVHKAYGLDVTDALIDFSASPCNFRFLLTRGVDIPLTTGTVDFAYSNQMLEHLHPEDAADQLREVCRVLKVGGQYMCITPSRVTGPHDISGYFDFEATGLHLKEYDYGSICALFRGAGFGRFSCFASIRGHDVRLPYTGLRAVEAILLHLPAEIRARLTRAGPIQSLLGLHVSASK